MATGTLCYDGNQGLEGNRWEGGYLHQPNEIHLIMYKADITISLVRMTLTRHVCIENLGLEGNIREGG